MLHVFCDIPTGPFARLPHDPSPLWWIIGIVAGVSVLTAVLIIVLVKRKKKRGE